MILVHSLMVTATEGRRNFSYGQEMREVWYRREDGVDVLNEVEARRIESSFPGDDEHERDQQRTRDRNQYEYRKQERARFQEYFIQDDWKISDRWTLAPGVRPNSENTSTVVRLAKRGCSVPNNARRPASMSGSPPPCPVLRRACWRSHPGVAD